MPASPDGGRRAARSKQARLTKAEPGADPDKPTPVGKATLDAFAALVPAEVLIAHATILQVTTDTDNDVTTITEPDALKFAFWALVITSAVIYLIGKAPKYDKLDVIRTLIPPVSFVGWTMVQKTTAFDAAFSLSEPMRVIIPVIAALIVTVTATSLAYSADDKPG